MADVNDAVEFVNDVTAAESKNRTDGEFDYKFSYGDQWPAYATVSRGLERPQLTVNELDAYIRQVANNQRQQRPRGKAHPVDDKGDVKVAKVVTGLGRHIEVMSNADHAYDTAFDHALRVGWGFWRLRTDYIRPDSFDQDIFYDTIDNPFSVYFDHMSHEPDGSDASRCVLTTEYSTKEFEREYRGAEPANFVAGGTGDSNPDWLSKDTIRVAEYYYKERVKAKLVKLSDNSVMWADQLPEIALLESFGVKVVGDRESMKTQVKWQKQTSVDVLEEKDIPGLYIPVVPVYGIVAVIDGYRRKHGIVRFAKDPQMMLNFWHTCITESYALASKAKWMIPEGADEGHENEWANANISPAPTLRFKTTGVDGQPIPAPQRIEPQAPEAAMINAAMEASRNLQKVLGISDPTQASTGPMSGKSLREERQQSENANFNYYDNLTRSIKHSWRIMLGWFPYVYDTERVQRIIGEDGKPELVTINQQPQQQPDQSGTNAQEGEAINKVLNCVCVGEYDVVMETGPGFDTKRQEGVEAMVQLMSSPVGEIVAKVGADILVRQIDAPQMDVLADRLAASNPMSQIDEQSDIPPQAQMALKGMQQQIQQMGQVIQQLEMEKKYRMDVAGLKDQGDTRRALIKSTADAHDTEQRNLSMQHSTEVKALTSQNVAEIQGLVKLLSQKLDGEARKLESAIDQRDTEQQIKMTDNAALQ